MRTRRVIVLLGLVLGTGVVGAGVVWRVRSGRRSIASAGEPPPVPPPVPPSWVEPVDGSCPASHPVKAKVGSGIYHLPGTSFYARTRPERCYVDAAAAEADGYRAAKTAAARSTA